MDAQQVVVSALKAASAVAAVVGTRIYPVVIPVNVALPAMAVQVRLGGALAGNVQANSLAVDVVTVAHAEADMHAGVEATTATLEDFNGVADSTYLRSLHRVGYAEGFDEDYGIWNGTVSFEGLLIGA